VPLIPRGASLIQKSALEPTGLKQAPKPVPKPVVTSSPWKVTNASELPSFYKLERSHISLDISPQQAADRIADCLRKESVAVSYDDKQVCINNSALPAVVAFDNKVLT
jgi:hypothetical protein